MEDKEVTRKPIPSNPLISALSTQVTPQTPSNQPVNVQAQPLSNQLGNIPITPATGKIGVRMPAPTAANVISDSQPVEFMDALPVAAKANAPTPIAPIATSVLAAQPNAETKQPNVKEQENYLVDLELPSVNWLKVNANFFDGSNAFTHWRLNADGSIQGAIKPFKRAMDLLLSWGYEFTNTAGVPGQGNYILMFFKLAKGASNKVKVHYSLLPKNQQKLFLESRG